MKVTLYTKEGKKKQEVVLNPDIFGVRVNARLLELVRNAYSANLRRGTANTKTREIADKAAASGIPPVEPSMTILSVVCPWAPMTISAPSENVPI